VILTACGGGGNNTNNGVEPTDTTNPVVVDVKGISEDGLYGIGSQISLSISFSEPVFVTGIPRLLLQNRIISQAYYVSGSGTDSLRFDFTVRADDSTADLAYYTSSQIILSSANIRDKAGNDAITKLAQIGTEGSLSFNSNIVIDGVKPHVLNVYTQSPNGTYSTGDTISITVLYNEPITVIGLPKLRLETGDIDAVASYNGFLTDTLVFEYLVDNTHTSNHLSYLYNNAFLITDVEIHDKAGNSVNRYMLTNGSDWFTYLPMVSNSSLYTQSFIQVNPSSGPIDTSYGKYGRAIINQNASFLMRAFGTTRQNTNTLICAEGFTLNGVDQITCTRITNTGNIDSTYGNNGVRSIPEPDLKIIKLALQTDGKMLLAGNSFGVPSSNDTLCRYSSDSLIDTSFGTTGCITGFQFIQALSVQGDGKILVVSGLRGSPPYKVNRYNNDGTADQTFSSVNTNFIEIDAGNIFVQTADVQSDGKVIIAGYTGSLYTKDAAIARFLNDGQPDISFGNGGFTGQILNGDDEYREVRVLPDLSVIAVGSSNAKFLISKFTTQGLLDSSFDADGTVTTSPWVENGTAERILVEPDGSFTVTGQSRNNLTSYIVAIKYLP
jgi:uncharacterized delta-60 repeat protein